VRRIALLADRLRVEERLIAEACAARGLEAVLLPPARICLSLDAPSVGAFDVAIERGTVTPERAALSALLASGGTLVINRAATARLLADRLALVRHLVYYGVPMPPTAVSFGEEATFAAIDGVGYPVILKSVVVDPDIPVALVEDRDAAEAIVEHRTMLGDEQAVLVQHFASGRGRTVRLAIVGHDLVGIEARRNSGWRPAREALWEPYAGDAAPLEAIASQLVTKLGSGVYAIEAIEGDDGLVVVGVTNLVDFRSLVERGTDVAGAIVDFAASEVERKGDGGLRD
jgi:[lysine-biosynthesis-protein LysW]--L-2-aminoadipate ligase